MRKYIAMIVAMIGMSCLAQSAVTNYIYETKIITNNVWTVTNIYVRTQNEITQNVNRVYTYWATNTISFVTNYYFTTNTTHYVTNIIDNVINVESNTIIEIHRPVNYYTNITTNYNYNRYIDQVIGTNVTVNIVTNYTTEITLDNFEEYVEKCENIISNGMISVSNTTDEAMLYAYIANESALRLGTTNEVIFSTNSYPYVDYEGVTHPNILCLACNNMNGVIQATPPEGSGGNATYKIQIGTGANLGILTGVFSEMYIAYANPTDQGMSVIYLPEDKNLRNIGNSQYKYHVDTCFWKTNHLICSISVYNPDDSFRYSYQFGYNWYLWPRNMSVFPPNGHVISSPGGYNEKSTIYLSAIGEHSTIYVKSFPSLEQWKYLWWFTHTTGFNFR